LSRTQQNWWAVFWAKTAIVNMSVKSRRDSRRCGIGRELPREALVWSVDCPKKSHESFCTTQESDACVLVCGNRAIVHGFHFSQGADGSSRRYFVPGPADGGRHTCRYALGRSDPGSKQNQHVELLVNERSWNCCRSFRNLRPAFRRNPAAHRRRMVMVTSKRSVPARLNAGNFAWGTDHCVRRHACRSNLVPVR